MCVYTRSNDVRALCAVNRNWAEMHPDVLKQLSAVMFVHKSAVLMKSLEFTYGRGRHNMFFGCQPALRVVATSPNSVFLRGGPFFREYRVKYREFDLPDFGTSWYDRYQIRSDRASGITLGRTTGSLAWMNHWDPYES